MPRDVWAPHAIQPRVAILNNGTRKGGQPDVMKVLHTSPGLEDLWQIHFSQLSGQEYTVPGMFIANLLDVPSAEMPNPENIFRMVTGPKSENRSIRKSRSIAHRRPGPYAQLRIRSQDPYAAAPQ